MPIATIGAIATLAAGSNGLLLLDGGYFQQVRLSATVASGTTTLTHYEGSRG